MNRYASERSTPRLEQGATMIGRLCTKPVVTASLDTTVAEAARLMRTKSVGTVVIVKGMNLIGLLTDRDIAVDVVGQGKDPTTTVMGDVMRKSLTVIHDTAGILDAAKLFGAMVGIIALDDVMMPLGHEVAHMASRLARSLKRAAA
jgi:CBS domain-containing protein